MSGCELKIDLTSICKEKKELKLYLTFKDKCSESNTDCFNKLKIEKSDMI
jgi:hypothetical protein